MATPNLNNLINNKSEPESTRSVPGSVDLRQRLAVALPFLILAGFGGVFLLLFGDALLPAERVRLENVITIQAEASAGGSSKASTRESAPVLFQSSGWVEADPFPVKATALVSGVVDSVEVLEGDRVKKGDVLARLVSADAELDLRTAIGNKQSFEAQAESHHREVDAIKAEASATAKRISVAEARAREFADPARRLSNLSNANVSTGEVLQARPMRLIPLVLPSMRHWKKITKGVSLKRQPRLIGAALRSKEQPSVHRSMASCRSYSLHPVRRGFCKWMEPTRPRSRFYLIQTTCRRASMCLWRRLPRCQSGRRCAFGRTYFQTRFFLAA
jgi:hypothetical protein